MRKIVPYNTGKVAIGSRYEPIKRHTMSLDEERIQDVLINPPVQQLSLPAQYLAVQYGFEELLGRRKGL